MSRLFRRLQRPKEILCACGHPDLIHMGLSGKCLAPLGNGSDTPPRRLSDLCYEVAGGCRAFRRDDEAVVSDDGVHFGDYR